ncbi:hypothetical protein ABKW28_04995 [Nocardioides sp. 31GB23]|uniref:hypothetical protein n=1 Tax=Nocardioides sp. 31GB23 TaxID=3156065 RepID=UPI0032AF830A
MDSEQWWKRVIAVLIDLPFTGNDPRHMTDLLRAAGYYDDSGQLPRPAGHSPEAYARACWRLRFQAAAEKAS